VVVKVLPRASNDLAVCTGQRRGDLLALKRDQLSDHGITFRQSKTGAGVLIEWSQDLHAIVARAKAMPPQLPGEYLLRKRNGRPYTEDGFSAIWQRLMVKYAEAGGVRFSFHDLRLGPRRQRRRVTGWATPASKPLSGTTCEGLRERNRGAKYSTLTRIFNTGSAQMARPERLLAAAPLVLRFAPDRRRALRGSVQPGSAGLSNSSCLSAGSSNLN
jgi:hypothetical protein